MKRFRKTLSLLIIVLFSVSMLTVTGCGWKPSEEDIKALEETKAAALAAEKTLEEKKAELEKAKADKEKVKMHVEEQQSGM